MILSFRGSDFIKTALYIILAIFAFGFLIFIHECGHYLMARLFKVSIKEFAIGMGPKLFSKTSKKTGIVYSLRAFPIGGFVNMVGEDEESDDENAFHKKSVWKRMIITVAGAAVNIIFGIVVMFIYIATSSQFASTVVYDFPSEEAVSYQYGLEQGDKIVEVEGNDIHIYRQLAYEIMRRGIEPVDLTVERNGETVILEDVVFPVTEESGTKLGTVDFRVYSLEKTFGNVIRESFYQSVNTVKMIWESLFDLIRGRYGIEAVSGPVGAAQALVETGTKYGFMDFIYLVVIISMNLGVMNLLPLPALDGGRIIFLIIEAIRRKPLKIEVESYINFGGLVLLLLFSVFIIFKDVIGLFN